MGSMSCSQHCFVADGDMYYSCLGIRAEQFVSSRRPCQELEGSSRNEELPDVAQQYTLSLNAIGSQVCIIYGTVPLVARPLSFCLAEVF